jgi:hypothetical protein
MKTPKLLGTAWGRIRPRTRKARVLFAAGMVVGLVVLSGALFVGGAMAWDPYLQFTLDHSTNERQWAALEISYTDASTCAECHEPQHAKLVSATHAKIGCESCHSALAEHVAAGDEADSSTVAEKRPTEETCHRCHTAAVGRPAGFRDIRVAAHYTADCLACHDPHTGISQAPPVVLHPLEDLPACVTCHGSDGFKSRNQRHPEANDDDHECLECHADGRGKGDNDGAGADGATEDDNE